MPLDRVTGEQFDVLVDHADGRVGHPCSRSLTSFSCQAPESQANHWRDTMGAYCLLESVPSHRASVGEILEVRWFDYYGAVIFGDRNEIACIPHEGCRLEITATAPSPHRKAELLLPGQVTRYQEHPGDGQASSPDARADREARLQGAGASVDTGSLRPRVHRRRPVRGGDDGGDGQRGGCGQRQQHHDACIRRQGDGDGSQAGLVGGPAGARRIGPRARRGPRCLRHSSSLGTMRRRARNPTADDDGRGRGNDGRY
jgi:hypothetical protein